ncbi:MAG: CpaD family pilus assembly protein [Candidatus Andeanibacterium colombiense]|uniref:CpaD family pilus assembly protein n=1 Tax=Candidatus Andeanibacterium colombiense TaxID=3121345 RepID=A0AAJ6BR22_9SPHN|nr:MAG: CpaD family pilus assembly protein [Sphingomonadaceae bacterium]
MTKTAGAALAFALSLSLAACASPPGGANRSLDSIKQPVVERSNLSFDLDSSGGGLSIPEQRRLNQWFAAMDLTYGDRISIDDPLESAATRQAVADIAARYGLLVSDGAPVTGGLVNPGRTRIVITRSKASVPGCPDWEGRSSATFSNSTSQGFGCAVNGNLAAMVADPEDLIHGDSGSGGTVIMTSNKAIESYRKKAPSGQEGLKAVSSEGSK